MNALQKESGFSLWPGRCSWGWALLHGHPRRLQGGRTAGPRAGHPGRLSTADLDAWAWELKFDGYGLPACGAGFAWAKALKPGRRIWWHRPATTAAAWHGCLCAAGLASSVHWTVPMVGERLATGNVPWECHDKPTASLGEATKQPVFQPRQEGWLGSYGRSRARLTCSGTPMVEAGGSRPTPHERRANEREIQGCFTR